MMKHPSSDVSTSDVDETNEKDDKEAQDFHPGYYTPESTSDVDETRAYPHEKGPVMGVR